VAREQFPIRAGRRSLVVLRLWGVRAGLAVAEVDDGPPAVVRVRFGRVRFEAPIDAIAGYRIEGPFHWITAIGIRRSIRHGDISFAGAAHGGVRVDLRQPIRWSIFRVPAFYVGADDLEGFAAALARRGVPGDDARRPTQ